MIDTHHTDGLEQIEAISARTQRRVMEIFEEALARPRLHTFGRGMVDATVFCRPDGRRGLVLTPRHEPGQMGLVQEIPPEERQVRERDFSFGSILAFENIEGVDVLIRALQSVRADMVLAAGPAEA